MYRGRFSAWCPAKLLIVSRFAGLRRVPIGILRIKVTAHGHAEAPSRTMLKLKG